ncbi:MAG: glycosyl transferase family 2 [Paenibacillaceae bacterium]|nr:glycosyl transferase family 2 [Paenibacillaceae bacterium]
MPLKRRKAAGKKLPSKKNKYFAGGGGAAAAGAAAGRLAAVAYPHREKEMKLQANRAWVRWWSSRSATSSSRRYHPLSRSFISGYYRAAGRKNPGIVPLSTEKSVTAVINVSGKSAAVTSILDQLRRLPLHEIIVVMSGPADGVWQLVRAHPADPVLIYCAEPLGADAGRAVGAKAATSDIVLFVDESRAVSAEELLIFIRAVAAGSDLALSGTGNGGHFGSRSSLSHISEFNNLVQGRRDLGAGSLSSYPHALSRQAIERLTPNRLAVPPLAQSLAVLSGLKVTAPASYAPGNNRRHSAITQGRDSLRHELVLGDVLESLHEQIAKNGPRAAYPDSQRRREMVKEVIPCG